MTQKKGKYFQIKKSTFVLTVIGLTMILVFLISLLVITGQETSRWQKYSDEQQKQIDDITWKPQAITRQATNLIKIGQNGSSFQEIKELFGQRNVRLENDLVEGDNASWENNDKTEFVNVSFAKNRANYMEIYSRDANAGYGALHHIISFNDFKSIKKGESILQVQNKLGSPSEVETIIKADNNRTDTWTYGRGIDTHQQIKFSKGGFSIIFHNGVVSKIPRF
ncbi:DUF3862 domain-containing protein [Furfurilactobacillus milii]|uniref:DUF3862 domain-containing protein n=1 Tax=Furfurilactobacillus milii TaxID=2888272 RepID=A0A6N9I334_9LACO|nr:DUF3862 domain-containing protein [Furfurilactobacillus milii]MYV17249.1 hypothetical protein [Furfurilactobacillus milii]